MRKFTDEPVSAEDTRMLLRAGLMAPSSKGMHSYEFVTVDDRGKIEALARCKAQGSDFLAGAPMAIVVAAEPALSDVWVEDASVAASFVMLQAEDLGLGACWIQVRERTAGDGQPAEDVVREVLGIPADRRVVCILAVGHKGMERKPQNEERLKWDRTHTGSY